jgi:ethanolamine ammonia-lyase small subunit
MTLVDGGPIVPLPSRTRTLMAELRRRLGADAPLPPPPPVAKVPPPPAQVFPTPRRRGAYAEKAAAHTTALLGIGHVGTRYATDVVLQFQAELAVAHAAVGTELPDGWADQNGFVGLCSRVTSHREFLLRPDLGRRLADASLQTLRARCTKGVDVQIIVADGLSAVACMQTGKQLAELVARACAARSLSVGTLVCARFARVWLEDEIGQEAGAKVAMILLGERPGLGTGDGLSAYVVYEPRIGKTDGDRNMISNIHARGTPPPEAAERLAALAAAMIAQRTSGVTLDLGRRDSGQSTEGSAGDRAGGGRGADVARGYRDPQVRQKLVNA